MSLRETKTCGACKQELPIESFGVDRGRVDCLNPYCKVCIRKKVTAHREANKEQGIKRRPAILIWKPRTRAQMVVRAIARGSHSRQEIRSATHLTMDEVVDALAILTFDESTTEIKLVDGEKKFFLTAA